MKRLEPEYFQCHSFKFPWRINGEYFFAVDHFEFGHEGNLQWDIFGAPVAFQL